MLQLKLPTILLLSAALSAPSLSAQTETDILTIAHTSIGSNGFGTTWRGQDVELADDTWLTRIVFQTGSATAQIDEIRLMTAVPAPVTLRSVTSFTTSGTEIEAVLPTPYLLRGGVRYTVWFHQNASPRGTYGCDLTRVDPTWGAYHTNVDPTQAPAAGEPGYYWHYQYGTNVRLVGYDNLTISGNLVVGGSATIVVEAPPAHLAMLMFALSTTDVTLPGILGPIRLDPATILPVSFFSVVGPNGLWQSQIPIPNDPNVRGVSLVVQGIHDQTFGSGGTVTPYDLLYVQ